MDFSNPSDLTVVTVHTAKANHIAAAATAVAVEQALARIHQEAWSVIDATAANT